MAVALVLLVHNKEQPWFNAWDYGLAAFRPGFSCWNPRMAAGKASQIHTELFLDMQLPVAASLAVLYVDSGRILV